MPRYYFDVIDGGAMIDDVGTELSGDHAMRTEAARFIATLLAEEPIRRDLGGYWRLKVRGGDGAQLLELRVYDTFS